MIQSERYKDSLLKLKDYLLPSGSSTLITGATGLIGSCMVDALYYLGNHFNMNYHIYALGRNLPKMQERFSYDINNSITYISQDITSPLITNQKFDYILHAASLADPVSYAKQPVETILTNVIGNKSVLDYCKNNLKTRLLITSTFEVYGNVIDIAEYKENNIGILDFNSLRACYPESKRCSEVLAHSYYDEYGVDYVVARLSSVYGPTMLSNDSKAHAQFLRKALAGQDVVLKSSGSQRRSYTYVLDVVSALLFLFLYGKSNEAYNISNSNSVCSIAELAHIIARVANVNVVFDLPSDIERKGFSTPRDSILSCDKVNELGWFGSYNVESGILETINILKGLPV